MKMLKKFMVLSLVALFSLGAVAGCGVEDMDVDELEEQLEEPMEPVPEEPADGDDSY